jgi:hypothetical protein
MDVGAARKDMGRIGPPELTGAEGEESVEFPRSGFGYMPDVIHSKTRSFRMPVEMGTE